jgi:hypothetical protein
LALVAANAQAEKVGVAAAVNPDAFSSLAGKPQAQLNIGKSIFYNERINTTGSGLVQVLLIDGSTFTVGPGSDLVIDKFVYNPKKGTGELSASFSKGVMRFVGGKLSKNEGGVTVDTPTGALAIRGGIAYLQYSGPKNYAYLFVYGHSIQMNGEIIYQPGTGFINGAIKPFNAALINSMMASLTNSNTGGGQPPDPPKPSNTTWFNTQNLNQLIVDATTEQIVTQAQEAAKNQTEEPAPCEVDCDGSPPGHIQGYAGGLYIQSSVDHEGDAPVGVVANQNSTHVDLTVPQPIGTLSDNYVPSSFTALFQLRAGAPWEPAEGGANFTFGDPDYVPVPPEVELTAYFFGNYFGLTSNVQILDDNSQEHNLAYTPYALLVSSWWSGESNSWASETSFSQSDVPDNLLSAWTGQSDVPDNLLSAGCESDCDFVRWGFVGAIAGFEDPFPDDLEHIQNLVILDWWERVYELRWVRPGLLRRRPHQLFWRRASWW